MTENIQTNYSNAYLQDNDCAILFDQDGNILKPENSTIDVKRLAGQNKTMYLNNKSFMDGQEGWLIDGKWYFEYRIGARYGLNTETANVNPTFRIDKKNGVINFSSDMADKLVVLEYVSDGLERGDDNNVVINKLAEDYLYSYIRWAILDNKLGVQEYIVNRARKEKTAKLRNAKIRLSDLHPGRLLMPLRGRDKWIK